MKAWALLPLAIAACGDVAPHASAQRVSSREQLIGGPKALGQIGDYLLENDKIRVIIHGPGYSRANTLYGGSLLDADLQRPGGAAGHGNDELGEILPSFNLEIMNPVTIRITGDGLGGGPAVVSVEGTGADFLQMTATLARGLLYSPELRFREDYRLAPGKQYVEIETTVTNVSSGDHPLPYLDPSQLSNVFGTEIPDLDKIHFSVPFGHLLLFGGENQTFTPGVAGFNVRFAIEDTYATAQGFPAFPGMVAEYVATRGRGVSYGFMVPSSPDDYPAAYRDLYAPQEVTDHSLLLPYVYAAVTGVYTTNPPPMLAPGESFQFTSYLVVGRGDVGSVVDVMQEIRGITTGTFAGRVRDARTQAPVAGAMVVVLDPVGRVVDEFDTDDNGAFLGHLPPGSYLYRIVTQVRDTTPSKPFQVKVGRTTSILAQLEPPARLAVEVVDELGRRVPCKVSLIGRFADENLGKDPRTFLYDLRLGERERPTTFDPTRDEYIESSWYLRDGLLEAEVRPGRYDLAVMRGIEYDLHTEPMTLAAGGFREARVTLHRAFPTDGWIAADFHLHSANSSDSGLALPDRVTSIAGEGLEFAAATDHNFITDYRPTIAELGLQKWLSSTVGTELTTSEMGHFNAYPLRFDPGSVRGGEYQWVGQTPDSLFSQLRALGTDPKNTIVEVNHPRDGVLGYFGQFNLDSETGEPAPRSGLRAIFAPFRPEFAPEAFSYKFDALEVLNAKRTDLIHSFRGPDGEIVRDADGRIAYPGQVDDWFTLLSRGKTYTAVGNSDSHEMFIQEAGYPRNFVWVGEGKDEQGKFTERDVVAGLRAHRVVATYGPMIEMAVDDMPIGSLVASGGEAEVALRVRSANFAPVETVRLWVNGEVARELPVPERQSHDFQVQVTLALTRDSWIVAEALGSANMFPVVPPQEFEPLNVNKVVSAMSAGLDLSGLSPGGDLVPSLVGALRPYAITNPIWCDVDGNGRFDPPLPPIPARPTAARAADVRAAFDAIEEVGR